MVGFILGKITVVLKGILNAIFTRKNKIIPKIPKYDPAFNNPQKVDKP